MNTDINVTVKTTLARCALGMGGKCQHPTNRGTACAAASYAMYPIVMRTITCSQVPATCRMVTPEDVVQNEPRPQVTEADSLVPAAARVAAPGVPTARYREAQELTNRIYHGAKDAALAAGKSEQDAEADAMAEVVAALARCIGRLAGFKHEGAQI